jgi:hypothetical protein
MCVRACVYIHHIVYFFLLQLGAFRTNSIWGTRVEVRGSNLLNLMKRTEQRWISKGGQCWLHSASCNMKDGGVMLTTHPLLVPRVRNSRSYTSCHPDAPLWTVTGPLYLFYCTLTKQHLTVPCPRCGANCPHITLVAQFASWYDGHKSKKDETGEAYSTSVRDETHIRNFSQHLNKEASWEMQVLQCALD